MGRSTSSLTAIVALALALMASVSPARAAGDQTWLHVTVDGRHLTQTDLTQVLMWAFFSGSSDTVTIAASKMPAYAPYLWYAGNDPKTGKPSFWVSKALEDRDTTQQYAATIQREQIAAGVLYALASGKGTPALRALYTATPADPVHRQQLAQALAGALRTWSNETVAKSKAGRAWMFAALTAGMPRNTVYALLRARGLKATSGGMGTDAFPASGSALVNLPGAFEPGCSFSRDVTIQFDSTNRLYKLDLSEPIPDCL